jgi:hypothetical protein
MGLVSGQNRYIPIKNRQGGGVDISSASREKARGQKKMCMKYRELKNKQPVEKVIFFRLIKNAQMQGARNPEE